MLKPLLVAFYPYTYNIYDFIMSLLISKYYNRILIVINHLIKGKYYISYITNGNGTFNKATAQLLFQNISMLYDFLLLFTLDKSFWFILRV